MEGADVMVEAGHDDGGDESMRLVREVNEDPPEVLKVFVNKTMPATIDRLTVSFKV